MQEYRQALAARYAQLETMPYTRRLKLERNPNWRGNRTTYTVENAAAGKGMDRKHALIVVGDRRGSTINYAPDDGEILISDCRVYKIIY